MKAVFAPFPYFGGKRAIVDLVWSHLGDCEHYLEPFFGSGAMLLGRPNYDPGKHTETVSDLNGHICNVWRAIKNSPNEVAKHADWPVNMTDLHARCAVIHAREEELNKSLLDDPEWHDAKLAGWWIWASSASIGTHMAMPGSKRIPRISSPAELFRVGVDIHQWMNQLSSRIRHVRVCYGDYKRILGGNWQEGLGEVGIFFDPPYFGDRYSEIYLKEDLKISTEVREYCIKRERWRIVLCGLEGEHSELESRGWQKIEWKAQGGYANQRKGDKNNNRHRERIWVSPGCLASQKKQLELF